MPSSSSRCATPIQSSAPSIVLVGRVHVRVHVEVDQPRARAEARTAAIPTVQSPPSTSARPSSWSAAVSFGEELHGGGSHPATFCARRDDRSGDQRWWRVSPRSRTVALCPRAGGRGPRRERLRRALLAGGVGSRARRRADQRDRCLAAPLAELTPVKYYTGYTNEMQPPRRTLRAWKRGTPSGRAATCASSRTDRCTASDLDRILEAGRRARHRATGSRGTSWSSPTRPADRARQGVARRRPTSPARRRPSPWSPRHRG